MTLVIHFLWLIQHLAGLAKLLQLKIGAKAILTVKIDIQDRLIIGQAGKVAHIDNAQNFVRNVCGKFSNL